MSEISSGTVLITGPTGGLGRSATMAMASRPEGERPDLRLIGRPSNALAGVAAEARAAGATARATQPWSMTTTLITGANKGLRPRPGRVVSRGE